MSILGAMAPMDMNGPIIHYVEPRRRYGYPSPKRKFRNAGEDTGWGSCRRAKNLDNTPDRAKGMRPFDIDGMVIYAGTLKAARKKHALLIASRSTP